MRILITIFLISFSILAFSQKAILTLKDSTKKSVNIISYNAECVYISGKRIYFKEIASAVLQNEKKADQSLINYLKTSGVKVSFGFNEPFTKDVESQTLSSPLMTKQSEQGTLPGIDYESFVAQRNTGKIMQLLGVAAIGMASYLQLKYDQDAADNVKTPNYKPSHVSPYVPIAGLGFMGIGLIVDINAGKHLRRKH